MGQDFSFVSDSFSMNRPMDKHPIYLSVPLLYSSDSEQTACGNGGNEQMGDQREWEKEGSHLNLKLRYAHQVLCLLEVIWAYLYPTNSPNGRQIHLRVYLDLKNTGWKRDALVDVKRRMGAGEIHGEGRCQAPRAQ